MAKSHHTSYLVLFLCLFVTRLFSIANFWEVHIFEVDFYSWLSPSFFFFLIFLTLCYHSDILTFL